MCRFCRIQYPPVCFLFAWHRNAADLDRVLRRRYLYLYIVLQKCWHKSVRTPGKNIMWLWIAGVTIPRPDWIGQYLPPPHSSHMMAHIRNIQRISSSPAHPSPDRMCRLCNVRRLGCWDNITDVRNHHTRYEYLHMGTLT